MMKQFYLILIGVLCIQSVIAQNSSIKFIDLPEAFDSVLEISGMVGHNDTLFLVSEREKIVFELKQSDYSITNSIDLTKAVIAYNLQNPDKEINISAIEMEGVTWFRNNLLFVDEGNTAIYKYDLNTSSISKLQTNLDLSEFRRSLGMEGIAVNPDKNLLYILRERNGNKQSEIYTLKISGNCFLQYDNQKYTIDHPSNNWRYSDIYYEAGENTIYALRSYYERNDPDAALCYIDKIPVDENGFLDADVIQSKDQTLSEQVIENRCIYVSNLEGIYKTGNKILIVSDNQRGTKQCDSAPIKTMFIEYIAE